MPKIIHSSKNVIGNGRFQLFYDLLVKEKISAVDIRTWIGKLPNLYMPTYFNLHYKLSGGIVKAADIDYDAFFWSSYFGIPCYQALLVFAGRFYSHELHIKRLDSSKIVRDRITFLSAFKNQAKISKLCQVAYKTYNELSPKYPDLYSWKSNSISQTIEKLSLSFFPEQLQEKLKTGPQRKLFDWFFSLETWNDTNYVDWSMLRDD